MIKLTQWYDKLVAIIVVILMVWISISTLSTDYKEHKELRVKEAALKEPDPLIIKILSGSVQTICSNGMLELHRFVKTNKKLVIHVQRSIVKLDDNLKPVEVIKLPNETYTEYSLKGKRIAYLVKIPPLLKEGNYIYVSTLTYKVNKYLTITKKAPNQFFIIDNINNCK